ncbi:uncharacterized protein EI97DRAFT_47784 [Westerdykella ornata]|uniref:Uncharacterized protein n=1 Tax=Westerdykella ornata TaxID=318751 RepID=A0A6A6JI33_WESOR|nr:uncharacterized protein EI97DRAFT_47784 [Westerdykella ornata]KAF2276072.1 hypothetical protein EI97DRAFT_47784 [Westerdykella ornata]
MGARLGFSHTNLTGAEGNTRPCATSHAPSESSTNKAADRTLGPLLGANLLLIAAAQSAVRTPWWPQGPKLRSGTKISRNKLWPKRLKHAGTAEKQPASSNQPARRVSGTRSVRAHDWEADRVWSLACVHSPPPFTGRSLITTRSLDALLCCHPDANRETLVACCSSNR